MGMNVARAVLYDDEPCEPEVGHEDLTVEEFDRMRGDTQKKAIDLDGRTRQEYEAGHIPGSIVMAGRGPGFESKIGQLEKVNVYRGTCASG